MVDIKRNRGKNFLDQEKETIIDLIVPHKSIIENIKVSTFIEVQIHVTRKKYLTEFTCSFKHHKHLIYKSLVDFRLIMQQIRKKKKSGNKLQNLTMHYRQLVLGLLTN